MSVACPHCGQASTSGDQQTTAPPRAGLTPGRYVCPRCKSLFQLPAGQVSGQVACPSCAAVVTVSPPTLQASAPPPSPAAAVQIQTEPPQVSVREIEIPTEDGAVVTVRDPVKTVRKGSRVILLRQLSPAEKHRRRTRRNVVLWVVGAAILVIAATILSRL